jgi:hypothetical protein
MIAAGVALRIAGALNADGAQSAQFWSYEKMDKSCKADLIRLLSGVPSATGAD